MTIEHGLLMGGLVVPDTDRVIRDPAAWWGPDDYGAYPRGDDPVEIGIAHWTAGEAGVKTGDDDGPFVVRGMKNRLSTDPFRAAEGIKLRVSVTFVIGATGLLWQTSDPITTVPISVGMGPVNRRSWAAEIVNPGTGPMHPARKREVLRLRMFPSLKFPKGRIVKQLAYYPAQMETWVWLCETMARVTSMPRQVPRGANGDLELERFTKKEQRRWRGVQEHYHIPTTTKSDGGTQPCRALMAAGWPTVVP